MAPFDCKPQTLRRVCQACARGKRRCDQRWPQCSRCQARGLSCEYANVPLTGDDAGKTSTTTAAAAAAAAPLITPTIHYPLPMEIPKRYGQSIITLLVEGVSSIPLEFTQNMKTHFIHSELWPRGSRFGSLPPAPIRDMHAVCQLYPRQHRTTTFRTLLRQKTACLYRQVLRAASFEEALASAQALLLAQCMLIATESPDAPYSEATSAMLLSLGQSTLSPRRAWLFAESVRRTIIAAFVLRGVYSLKKRNYSVRTPFIDSLPFDMRTALWDASADSWTDSAGDPADSIVSLHQYSGMLESGLVHAISPFGGLILAACRGKAVEEVAYPPRPAMYAPIEVDVDRGTGSSTDGYSQGNNAEDPARACRHMSKKQVDFVKLHAISIDFIAYIKMH
ncbi:hypothetical protein BDW72DRAFT_204761 [Aspergillus terricola var. indicus]